MPRRLVITSPLVALSLLAACSSEPRTTGDEGGASPRQEAAPPPETTSAPPELAASAIEEVELPPTAAEVLAAAELEGETEASVEALEGETEGETEASVESAETEGDPLAPIAPSGPTPGSAEADAELLALLDESTLTQDEFAKAFGKGGVEVEGDALVFGRPTRATPVVTLTRVEGEGAAEVEALARRQLPQLVACQAMALSKQPETAGALTLRLRYAKGKVETVEVVGAASLGTSLHDCLASVARGWASEAASGELNVSLKLGSK